jgi:hypothetical protein
MIREWAALSRQRSPIFMPMRQHAAIILLLVCVSLFPAALHGQANPPLTLDQIRSLVSIGDPDATIANEIDSRGIAFQPSEAILSELAHLNAGPQTLAALRKLIPSERTICESFGGCMGGGQHAFHDKEWNEAKAYFQQAAIISQNSGQAWNSLGKVYLALQQTQAAYSAWDKALNSEDGVALTACMENGQPICDGGTLRLTSTTLFRYKGDEKVFEVPLSAVTVIGTIRHGWPSYLTFEMLVNGTSYGFDFFPITVNCYWTNVLVCPAEGKVEQAAMGSYFEQAVRRLVPGGPDGDAIFPPVETSPQTASPPLRIHVWHRHRPVGAGFVVPDQITYCQGFLTVYQGNVEYDCTMPDRTLGRCEHSIISPVRSVEFKGGGLRIVGRGGSWDFFGNANDLTRAHDAIAATLRPHQ